MKALLVLAFAALLVVTGSAHATTLGEGPPPTISSDKADYNPGSLVTLTGAGWQPGESVHVAVNDDQGQTWSFSEDRTADSAGGFTVSFTLPSSFVALYSVSATGSSGATATTSFTDGNGSFLLATAGQASPPPSSYGVSWQKYGDATCTTAVTTGGGSGTTTYSGGAPTNNEPGVGNNQSVKPTGVTPPAGYDFAYWSTSATSTTQATTAELCLVGPGGGVLYAHFTLSDTTAPTLHLPANITAEATGPFGAAVSFAATADDANPLHPTVNCSPASGSTFALGATTVNCSATDTAGNTANGSFTVTVQDTTAPALNLPAGQFAEATGPTGAAVSFSASATDIVDGSVAVNCSPGSGSTFALGTTTVNCSAADAHGNSAAGSFHVTVHDTTDPVLHDLPADLTAEATSAAGAAVSYTAPSATDLADPNPSVSCAPASGSTFPLGTTPVTCTATDASGNDASGSFHVTVQDTTPPAVAAHADVTAEATGPTGAAVSFSNPAASDLVDGSLATTCAPAAGSTFALGDTTVSCSATDSHGNTGSNTFTVSVVDTTGPAFTVPDDQVLEATGPLGAGYAWSISATDLVDGPVSVTCTPPSPNTFVLGTTVVGCSATDAHGNATSHSFDVTVVDTTPPTVDAHADVTEEATGPAGAVVTFTNPSASDVVDGALATTCAPSSGSTFALGNTTVSCSATDAHGNTGHGSFTVTVQDTTPPVVATHADETAEATGPAGAVVTFTSPAASDLVDGALATTCVPASGSAFPLGNTTVSCSATDAHGNTGHGSFTVTVRDTTPPVVAAHADETAEATGPAGAVVTFTSPAASDLVDGALATTCVPASGSTFALGDTTVDCSATDAHGNTGHGSFTVTVRDTTPPALSLPADITAEATGAGGAAVSFTASAADLVDGSVAVSCAPASGSTFPLGTTTVNCSATDAHGNAASGGFMVTVLDTTAPTLNLPANITAEATGPAGAAVTYTATATDLVDGSVPITCSPASGSTFPLGTTTVSCSATDAHGNTASGSFSVKVQDTTPPAITVPADIVVIATSAAGAVVSYTTSANDLVDGSVAVSCSPPSGTTFPPGATIVTCTATDAHGNTAQKTFKVTVSFTVKGFLAPVDNASAKVMNVAKNGSTVPLKFQVLDAAGGYIRDLGIVTSFTAGLVVCASGEVPEDVITTTGGTSLRYDLSAEQFVQNWQTPKQTGKCFRAVVKLTSGQTLVADFQLK